MKLQTKLKFVHWIERLLKIDYTSMAGPLIVEKSIPIQIAQAEHLYTKREYDMVAKEQIRFGLGLALISEIDKINAIEYTEEKYADPYIEGGMKVKAKLLFIVK